MQPKHPTVYYKYAASWNVSVLIFSLDYHAYHEHQPITMQGPDILAAPLSFPTAVTP